MDSTFNLKDYILRLGRLICQTFKAQDCSIVLLDASKKFASLRCTLKGKTICVSDKKTRIEQRLEKKIIRSAATLIKKNILAMPLIAEDIIGVIALGRKKKDKYFNGWDAEILMTTVQQAIMGIKYLQLYEEQQKVILGSIKSLVTLFDLRMPREYAHSPHFFNLVQALAQEMHLNEKQIESLKYASLLHDAGKVDIPVEILTKTGRLTPQEYQIIRRHPSRGAQILRSLQILKPAIPIIMHHHEKYDGSGYPSRLKKGQIPIGARIMAVADAFEAMVYGRPYRERISVSKAIMEIKKKANIQFDPKVVDALLKAIKTKNVKKYLKSCVF